MPARVSTTVRLGELRRYAELHEPEAAELRLAWTALRNVTRYGPGAGRVTLSIEWELPFDAAVREQADGDES